MPETITEPGLLDLSRYIRSGDTVVWGQACGEPQTLTETLLAQRASIGPFRCFLGIPAARTVRPEHGDHVRFVSYCGSGGNKKLYADGVLDVVPSHYSTLPHLLAGGSLRADVVLIQVAPAGADGRHSLGLADDYVSAAIPGARVVIAEVNDQVPRTPGDWMPRTADFDVVVHTSRAPAEMPPRAITAQTQRIAEHVAGLIDDGATLQFGIGALPEAVLSQLTDRTDLGVHSGLLNDTAAELMAAGVITNARKSVDRGRSVAGLLMGTRRLFRFADGNPAIQLRGTRYTHDPSVLAAQDRLVAVNSAVEVDLTGQVNAEVAGGQYVGAVGGAVDFLRGASRSHGGKPIVALPAMSGGTSKIVARLSGPVSTARCDAGFIVTEYGVADLRGQPLKVRRERMLAVAHPEQRPVLEAAIDNAGVPV
ncbi:acetyl-CoA hydrolase/transferase family protein [Amycolatopsis echigonensis]|uniref:Acetyl-CoA hydrolase/transferase family protein n=1 Tax=Amycolatopsis echigonensis TaxID=2576905 RepID=A0A8E1W687_9PSEU|nr:acetyl-CoA hydrolase/transferase family protein [Amycolatopsis echigonensis]MBB2504940.1 acetyl-CoA hydrolase/transferase family protein [Amycolatopsis echigonensis]